MNKAIVLASILSLALGWSISGTSCSCSQLGLQADCTNSGCSWNTTSTSCGNPTVAACSTYSTEATCLAGGSCYWSGLSTATTGSCLEYTSYSQCSSLSATSQDDCDYQLPGCLFITGGKTCSSPTCANIYAASNACTNGTTISAVEGVCYSNAAGTSCTAATSCSQLEQTSCALLTNACQWAENACSTQVCSNLGVDVCNYIASINTQSISISPCYVNGTTCAAASGASSLNATYCLTNTESLYHWSSNVTTDGSCTSCYAVLIQVALAIILLFA